MEENSPFVDQLQESSERYDNARENSFYVTIHKARKEDLILEMLRRYVN